MNLRRDAEYHGNGIVGLISLSLSGSGRERHVLEISHIGAYNLMLISKGLVLRLCHDIS